jgi:hypothetical protein
MKSSRTLPAGEQGRARASAHPGSKANPFRKSCPPEQLAEEDLSRSGITLAAAARAGIIFSEDASTICEDFAPAPALIIPYFEGPGRPETYQRDGVARPFCRARYLVREGAALPRGRKYDQPHHSGTPPYFSLAFNWARIADGEVDACVIVEGEKKAIALCQVGIPAIAVGGVYNFGNESAALHPSLAAVVRQCTHIYIAYDSDAVENPQIQVAEWRLAGQLAQHGAQVHIVRIPEDGDNKVGADDYLVKFGREALEELILDTPVLGAQVVANSDYEASLSELLAVQVHPVEELITGWLQKGIPTFLAGPGGVHKSRLAMQWALCLNAGAPIWGIDAGLMRKAPDVTMVYCAAEDDRNELARRAQAISACLRLRPAKKGIFVERKGQDSALAYMHENARAEVTPFYHQLLARLRHIPGHKVVVLDSAYDFVRFVDRAKISEDAVNYFIKIVLQGICDKTDSTLIIPWHPSQAGSERSSMDGWSVAWNNAPRARLGLSAVQDANDIYELKVLKRNHGRKGNPLRLRYHEGALLPIDAVPDDGKLAAFRKVCVAAAIEAAHHGMPLNRRDAIRGAVFREAEKTLGRRPSRQEIRDTLEDAVRAGELLYLTATRHRLAGFYPCNFELACDLANTAKKAAKGIPDA